MVSSADPDQAAVTMGCFVCSGTSGRICMVDNLSRNVREGTLWQVRPAKTQRFHIPKKNRLFFIQERFNKLIYGINTIIKCGI